MKTSIRVLATVLLAFLPAACQDHTPTAPNGASVSPVASIGSSADWRIPRDFTDESNPAGAGTQISLEEPFVIR